ncbi:hypothetical protein Lal_00017163 [Lupinus albus]|uniref:Putative alpha-L-fucosidase n=1 Tax=Lupinus albus TaxID=3870 RepID=A0A6A4QPW9_LUPAL|nr:putative alpha-L-fucosidase [Lupinus albus]KAF1869588.1 hypothetical protein Lal_00017163 [Lupinus albus]
MKMSTLEASYIVWKFIMACMVIILLLLSVGSSDSLCEFEGLFNFGDSNSDTGGFYSAFPTQVAPNGMTYFKKPVGRSSDGRLIVDFLAEGLGIAFLSPYLKSIGSDYRHGANFANSASTVLPPTYSFSVTGVSPFHLGIQLTQMKHFKAKVADSFTQHKFRFGHGRRLSYECPSGPNLPSPEIFAKSIYTVYIGQNDFTSKLASLPTLKDHIPKIISQIDATIKELYLQGGRTFLIFNLGPMGCYPRFLVEIHHENSDIDEFGCVISHNNAVNDYNKHLKETLTQSRESLKGASLIYVDTHSIILKLFQHPTSHGLKYGTKTCCGNGGGDYNFNPKIMCGNMAASACDDPQNYVSWDGIHLTDSANKIVSKAILNGSIFYPSFPLHKLCDLHPID